jgi:hypothetical protein
MQNPINDHAEMERIQFRGEVDHRGRALELPEWIASPNHAPVCSNNSVSMT